MEYRQRRSVNNPQMRKKRVFTPTEEASASSQHAGYYEEDDASDDVIVPRIAHIVPRYNRIPTADGYIEKRGNQQMHVHFVDTPPQIVRASRRTEEPLPHQVQRRPRTQRRFHWLFFVGIVFLVMIVGYVGLNAVGAWWQVRSDDSTYGRPRTYQTDAVVGHGDSEAHPSHFIAMNLNRRIIIIEIPGGDVSKSVIYTGPTLLGDGQGLTPVTLTFSDANGDEKIDMVLHILDQTIVYLNNGTKFVPPSTTVADGGGFLPHMGGEQ